MKEIVQRYWQELLHEIDDLITSGVFRSWRLPLFQIKSLRLLPSTCATNLTLLHDRERRAQRASTGGQISWKSGAIQYYARHAGSRTMEDASHLVRLAVTVTRHCYVGFLGTKIWQGLRTYRSMGKAFTELLKKSLSFVRPEQRHLKYSSISFKVWLKLDEVLQPFWIWWSGGRLFHHLQNWSSSPRLFRFLFYVFH